jgi:hypothetical protein
MQFLGQVDGSGHWLGARCYDQEGAAREALSSVAATSNKQQATSALAYRPALKTLSTSAMVGSISIGRFARAGAGSVSWWY